MTRSHRRFAHAALLLVTAVVLLGPRAGLVSANGIGDLYISTNTEVDELHVLSAKLINTVSVPATANPLAFSNDGRSLYVGTGSRSVARINIDTISLGEVIDLPAPAADLAYPRGSALVAALPSTRQLAIVDFTSGHTDTTAALPGAVNLLGADRRADFVATAAAGDSFVGLVDPATAKLVRSTTVSGKVVALALDARASLVYVATSAPAGVIALRLDTLKVAYTAKLSATPVAIAATRNGAVAAVKGALAVVDGMGTVTSLPTAADATALSVSDDGVYTYAAEGGSVEAYDLAGKLRQTIVLGGGRIINDIAAIPGKPSLVSGPDNGGPGSSGSVGPADSGGGPAGSDHLPSTNAEPTLPGSASDTSLYLTAGAIFTGLALVLALGLRRLLRSA